MRVAIIQPEDDENLVVPNGDWDLGFADRRDEARRLSEEGVLPAQIAHALGVPEPLVWEWNSEDVWLSLGFPAALARTRARSEHLKPRDPSTTATFARLVQQVFVTPLKEAGYRKTANTWTLRGDPVWTVIDIQRKWSNSDLLGFIINWTVAVPAGQASGHSSTSTRLHWSDTVVSGRIDEFLPRIRNWGYSWSIQLGWLARDFPQPVIDDPDKCEEEIASGLSRMITFLAGLDTTARLLSYVEDVERGRVLGPWLNPDRVAALRSLT